MQYSFRIISIYKSFVIEFRVKNYIYILKKSHSMYISFEFDIANGKYFTIFILTQNFSIKSINTKNLPLLSVQIYLKLLSFL